MAICSTKNASQAWRRMVAAAACLAVVLGGALSAAHGIADLADNDAQMVVSGDWGGPQGPHRGFDGHACVVHAGCSTLVPAGLSTNALFDLRHHAGGKALWRPDRQDVLASRATRPPTPPPKALART
jgi:hypothetical protein